MTPQQLVIRNLDVLEQASAIAEEVDEKIMLAIDNQVAEWTKSRRGWWCDADDNEWCCFGPDNWPRDQELDEYKAYYKLGTTSERDDDDYFHYLSALTGAVSVEFGIYFSVDAVWMTHQTGRRARPKAAWQAFLAEQLSERQELCVAGFRQRKGGLFLPIRLAPDDVAEAYPTSLEDALRPVDTALQTLVDTHEHIDGLIRAAERRF